MLRENRDKQTFFLLRWVTIIITELLRSTPLVGAMSSLWCFCIFINSTGEFGKPGGLDRKTRTALGRNFFIFHGYVAVNPTYSWRGSGAGAVVVAPSYTEDDNRLCGSKGEFDRLRQSLSRSHAKRVASTLFRKKVTRILVANPTLRPCCFASLSAL